MPTFDDVYNAVQPILVGGVYGSAVGIGLTKAANVAFNLNSPLPVVALACAIGATSTYDIYKTMKKGIEARNAEEKQKSDSLGKPTPI